MGGDSNSERHVLTRQTLLPISGGRRLAWILGSTMAIVLLAGAIDAVVWAYSAERQLLHRQVRAQIGEIHRLRQALEQVDETAPVCRAHFQSGRSQ